MQRVRQTLEYIYDRAITNEFDRVILVIADEGYGKSTFMLELTLHWRDILGRSTDAESVLDRVVWGERSELKQAFVDSDKDSIIPVQDAARALHRKESMHGEQVELQKAFLEMRINYNLIVLGFQSWGDVPTFLQERRAHNAFVIPRRGRVFGYNREQLDEKVAQGEWPDPALTDTFPPLDGTELWERFQERDEEHKLENLLGEEDLDPKTVKKREQAKIALRLVKPWDDDGGMSQYEAADYLDYSQRWISERVQEWRDDRFDDDFSDQLRESADSVVTA